MEKMKRPDTDSFRPRICYLNQSECSSCGKCQSTYYCDAFLDRVNVSKNLPPLMDNRNCNGCGLCVQVCLKGALHLYYPEEMLTLISSSLERRELLRSLEVPFLSFDPVKDLQRFVQEKLQEIDIEPEKAFSREQLRKYVDSIWEIRLRDMFSLGKGAEDLYPDLRAERRDGCRSVAFDLIDKISENGDLADCGRARAALWSQLLWSDPGQVLWDSFILLVQTFLEYQGDKWELQDGLSTEELECGKLKRDGIYRISSFVILLRQGKLVLSGWIPSHGPDGGFSFADGIFDCPEKVTAYNRQKMGRGRLAGLDIRSCGSFLIKGFENMEEKDKYAMAGMPWEKICELLEGNSENQDTLDALQSVKDAIKKREKN